MTGQVMFDPLHPWLALDQRSQRLRLLDLADRPPQIRDAVVHDDIDHDICSPHLSRDIV